MEKPQLGQPENIKFKKTFNRLFREFSICQAQYSITPVLHYYSRPCWQDFSFFRRLKNMAHLYDRYGDHHAQI
jgi:hypothetical protein